MGRCSVNGVGSNKNSKETSEASEMSKTESKDAQCCRKFYLPVNLEELKQSYQNFLDFQFKKMKIIEPIHDGIHLIYPMVNYISDAGNGNYIYSCKHISEEGKCTIYDIRPNMCRTFPEGTSQKQCAECETISHCNGFLNGKPIKPESLPITLG